MSTDRSEPVEKTLKMFPKLLRKGITHDPPADSSKFLLERFRNIQTSILAEFAEAETENSLSSSSNLINTLLQTHAEMWKIAVENDSLEILDLLRQLLEDTYQFREHEYAPYSTDFNELEIEDLDFNQKKQYRANNFRKQIENLRFAIYAWGIHLYTEGDLPESSALKILDDFVKKEFNSVTDLSNVFFRMRESDSFINIWERWNMNRELEDNFGVAMTGMAENTWLLKFYCSTLVWMSIDEDYSSIKSHNPKDSPILEYSERVIHVDSVIENIESYKKEYPLIELLENESSLAEVCDVLIDYFDDIKSIFEKHERDWTREQDLDEDLIQGFSEKVNSRVNDNRFRKTIMNTNGIIANSKVNNEVSDGFSISARMPRRLFIDTGIETFYNNSFSHLLDRYREFVIDNLQITNQKISSYNSLPSQLNNIISQHDAEVIITGDREAANILRSNENSNRISNDNLNSYLEYKNVPVINDSSSDFLVLVIFSQEYEYVEPSTESPITIDVIPGENVKELEESEIPDEYSVKDWVKVIFSYEAKIETPDQNGIILNI